MSQSSFAEWGANARVLSAQPGSLQENGFDFPTNKRILFGIVLDEGVQLFFSLSNVQDTKANEDPLIVQINLGQHVPQNYAFSYNINRKDIVKLLAKKASFDRQIKQIKENTRLGSEYPILVPNLVSQICYWMATDLFGEASRLNKSDQSALNKAREPNKSEAMLLQRLQDIQLKNHPRTIRNIVESDPDSDGFIKYLLTNPDEDIVRIGLWLMPAQLRGSLQDELIQVSQNQAYSRFVRDWADDLIFPSRRKLSRIKK